MASDEFPELSKLLAPIPGEHPSGINIRDDPSPVSAYQKVRSARTAAREAERRMGKGDDKHDQKFEPPDWNTILKDSSKILAEKSKDLEITTYFIESLVRLRGFAGLRDGYRVARELVDQFWDGLYPPAEDSDVSGQFSLILGLSGDSESTGTLVASVRMIPFTLDSSEGRFSLWHYLQALTLSQINDPKARQKRIDDGAATLEKIRQAVAETPAKFFGDLVEDINQGQEQFRGFCAALHEKSGYDPPSSDLLGVLDSYLDVVKDLAGDKLPKALPPSAAPADKPTDGGPEGPSTVATGVDPSVIRDRNDALDRLVKIAAYFREKEPQSIVPYALEQVVNWCKMPLPELLSALIPEDAPRNNLFKQVGIKPPEVKK